MAYLIKYNPDERYISAHGDVLFVVHEDTKPYSSSTYPDYKYICDVYIKDVSGNETLVTRLKSYPMPDSKFGVFNIGNIVRNYLAVTFAPNPNVIRCQQQGADEFYVQVICRFGEEYNFVTYPSIVVDSQRAYFNHYNGRQSGTPTILTNYLDKVLTTRPYKTTVKRDADHCFIPFLPSDDTQIDLEVRCYNKTLGFIRQQTFSFTPTADSIDELQQFNLSPTAINTIAPGTIDGIVDYYTVTFSTTNITDDSVYRFDLICESKYETQTLHFLNKFGGFESKEFTKVSRRTYDIKKTSYGNPAYTINPDGTVSWFNNTTKVYKEQTSTFASEFEEKMQLNTDILNDAEYVWLKELIISPIVYTYLNGYFYPVTITDTNYEERKTINDRLTNLTVSIEFGETFNAQFR